jgi:hypothetical protein
MNQIPTAFPWTHENMTCTGMTLRDYFAAKAMQVEMSGNAITNSKWRDEVAQLCYQMADAMLKAREQ